MADTLKILKCPACGEVMEKVFIPTEGINIDICTNGCGGIYFDNREFESFNEKNEDISEILKRLENKSFKPVDSTAVRYCPNCGAKMVKNHSSITKEIEVDDCYACGGKFLDSRELIKIREEYENDDHRAEDMLRYFYGQAGGEIAELNARHAKITANPSMLRNIVEKITRKLT